MEAAAGAVARPSLRAPREGRRLEAVIVTHNSAVDLAALIAMPAAWGSFTRVLVVDNGSEDDSAQIARSAGFEVLPQPVNRGFAAAANVGARHTRGPSFALLNPDVRFTKAEDLAALERHLDDPAVGAAAPALVLPSGALQDSARRTPAPSDLVVRRVTGRTPDALHSPHPIDVDWATGACLVLRRSAFESVGGFDERFFMYFEDVDLGMRLRSAGYRVRYDPTIQACHDHRAASRDSLVKRPTRHHMRSALRFYARHPSRILPQPLRPRSR